MSRPSSSRALAKAVSSRSKAGSAQRALLNKVARAASSGSSTTRRAIAVGGYAMPSRSGELKFKDVSLLSTVTVAVDTFSSPVLLNGMATGATATTRIGRKITLKSLLFRYRLNTVATTIGGSPIRFLIVYDKQANAAAPTILDVLEADDFTSPNNLSNRDRFVTLCDHITQPLSENGNQGIADVVYKPLNLETMFNDGTAGTISDITSGSVYLFFAQCSGLTTGAPVIEYKTRIRFSDL